MSNPPEIVIIVDNFTIDYELKLLGSYTLDSNVFITRATGIPGLLQGAREVRWPRDIHTGFAWGGATLPVTLAGAVIRAIAKAWKVPFEDITAANNIERETNIKIGIVD